MRRLVGIIVVLCLMGWSLFVYSAEREKRQMMAYADVLAEYTPLKKLGLKSEVAWSVIKGFYPDIEGFASEDPCKINHLVEIYLRSRQLAPCGHRYIHETVGTPCSSSRGSELGLMYDRLIMALLKGGALGHSSALYLMEHEPGEWSMNAPCFMFEGRILDSAFSVTEKDVRSKRKQLVDQGFQTAVDWSDEDVRASILRSQRGKSLSEIDAELGVGRGEVRSTFINQVVRPLYLLLHHDDKTYQGTLKGLPDFVAGNGADKDDSPAAGPSRKTKTAPASSVQAALQATPASSVRAASQATPASSVRAAAKTAVVQSHKFENTKKRAVFKGFARAYGGSRFRMGWGR